MLAEQALAAWQQVDDDVERALGYLDLGWVLRWAARLEDAVPLAEEGLAILRRTENRRLILRALVFLAHAFADLQDVTNTERVLTEAGALPATTRSGSWTPFALTAPFIEVTTRAPSSSTQRA